jgi:hypothetical protein
MSTILGMPAKDDTRIAEIGASVTPSLRHHNVGLTSDLGKEATVTANEGLLQGAAVRIYDLRTGKHCKAAIEKELSYYRAVFGITQCSR